MNKPTIKEKSSQQISNDIISVKTSKKTLSFKDLELKSESDHQLNTKVQQISSPLHDLQLNSSLNNQPINLPEFAYFHSDHLVLTPRLSSHLINDRLRGFSASSASKYIRQSIGSLTAMTTTNNTGTNSPTKRLSRSRHSNDSIIYHEKSYQPKYSKRSMPNKFDAISCFQEVSRLLIFFLQVAYLSKWHALLIGIKLTKMIMYVYIYRYNDN